MADNDEEVHVHILSKKDSRHRSNPRPVPHRKAPSLSSLHKDGPVVTLPPAPVATAAAPSAKRGELFGKHGPKMKNVLSYQSHRKPRASSGAAKSKNLQRQPKEVLPPPPPQGDTSFALHSAPSTPTRPRFRTSLPDNTQESEPSTPGRNLTAKLQALSFRSQSVSVFAIEKSTDLIFIQQSPSKRCRTLNNQTCDDNDGDWFFEAGANYSPSSNTPISSYDINPIAPLNPLPSQLSIPTTPQRVPQISNKDSGKSQSLLNPDPRESISLTNQYYPVLLARHAPAQPISICSKEGCFMTDGPFFNCDDCFDHDWYCHQCILKDHAKNPLHNISSWSRAKNCSSNTSLGKEGLVVSFLHSDGTPCQSHGTERIIEVLHTNGLHNVHYYKCNCKVVQKTLRYVSPIDLMANGLFPSTNNDPKSAFSFQVIQLFDVLNCKGAINIKEFCDSIVINSGTGFWNEEVSGRLRDNFHNCVRLWRLFRHMQERGFESYSDMLNKGMVEFCPCCSNPGVNMSRDWKNNDNRLLNGTRVTSADGNFHLPSSTRAKDLLSAPSLYGDSGVYVPYKLAKDYVNWDETNNKSSKADGKCSTQAGNPSKDRPTKNNRCAGVVATICEHGLYIANGTIDLEKGERYAAVDVPFQIQVQDALKNGMDRIIFGYDIACNFSINAYKRCVENPNSVLDPQFWESLKPENNVVLFRVNKFHLHSHKPSCSDRFSLNYTKGVGMRSLEEVESNWSHMNHIQYEVREMDAGARIDTITTHMLALNNSKINNMPVRLQSRLSEAVGMVEKMQTELREAEQAIVNADPQALDRYKNLYETHGGEQFRPNEERVRYPTQASVLESLHEEERQRGSMPGNLISRRSTISLADRGIQLDIEWSSKAKSSSISKQLQLEQQITAHLLEAREIFPALSEQDLPIGTVALGSLCSPERSTDPKFKEYCNQELDLRVGRGHELLQELRTIASLSHYHGEELLDTRGYAAMKSNAKVLNRIAADRTKLAGQYTYNWNRITTLLYCPWVQHEMRQVRLKGLKSLDAKKDIKYWQNYGEGTNPYMGHIREDVSWIWTVAMVDTRNRDQASFLKALDQWADESRRLKWVHTFARTERWKEEVLKVTEEMKRLGSWYKYKIQCFKVALEQQPIDDSWAARGKKAMFESLLRKWEERFDKLPSNIRQSAILIH